MPAETPLAFVRDPVGTGPYKLTQWNPGQNIMLEARSDYWGQAPAVKKATYVFRSDPAVARRDGDQGRSRSRPVDLGRRCDRCQKRLSYLNSETLYLRIDSAVAPIDRQPRP